MDQALQRVPFLRLTLPFIAGILWQYHVVSPALYWLLFFTALAFFAWHLVQREVFGRRWLFGAGVYLFCFVAGAWSMSHTMRGVEWDDVAGKSTYTGVLEEYPSEKKKTVLCRLRLEGNGKRVMAYIAKDSLSCSLIPGQILRFSCRFNPLEKAAEPVEFDYNAYLKKQGYSATAFVRAGDWSPEGQVFHFKYKTLEWQRQLAAILREVGFGEQAYAFGTTMLLGCRDLMDADLTRSFSVSGISHVISISGLHTQIIFAMFFFLFSFLGNSRKNRLTRQVIILVCMWVFTCISGLSPSVVRASAMLTFYGLADIFGKQALTLNVVFASAFLMMLYNPFYLFDISFQLSYLAVLAIVLVFPGLERLHVTSNPMVRYLWSSFCISLAAQLATTPLCLYYFHQFPSYFLLANVVMAPLVGPALIGMIAILVIHPLVALPLWCYKPVEWMLDGIILTAEAIELLPYSQIKGIELNEGQTLLLYGCILSALAFLYLKRVKYIYLLQLFVLLQVICYL